MGSGRVITLTLAASIIFAMLVFPFLLASASLAGAGELAVVFRRLAPHRDLQEHDGFFLKNLASRLTTRVPLPQNASTSIAWIRDGSRVYFSAPTTNSIGHDLFALDIATGDVTQVTSTPNHDETSPVVTNDGRRLYFARRIATGDSTRKIVELVLETSQQRVLSPDSTDDIPTSLSSDGMQLLLTRADGEREERVVLRDLVTDAEKVVAGGKNPAREAQFMADDDRFVFTRMPSRSTGKSCVVLASIEAGLLSTLSCSGTVGASAPSTSPAGALVAYAVCDPCHIRVTDVQDGSTDAVTSSGDDLEELAPVIVRISSVLPPTGSRLWPFLLCGFVLLVGGFGVVKISRRTGVRRSVGM